MMRRPVALMGLGLVLLLAGSGRAVAEDVPMLPFEQFTLDNGLHVILHEDHTIPTVAVNVWYHVGSKNEKPGRTGFAHLFEHMMFQGSLNHDTDYFPPLYDVGAEVNGSTSEDRTNYWENVPSDQLELALWLEADRMGFLLPAMTEERLANQKDVVKNEKRQFEDQPYAKSEQMKIDLLFDREHPYSHSIIGSMEDLSAATVDDVSEFFKLYYAPNNASLCIAGDFDPAAARRLVERYFGPIPPGRPVDRLVHWEPRLDCVRRAVAEDAVELPRLYMAWHTPAWYEPGDAESDLLSDILASGKNSRLYRRLVYELEIAQDVSVTQESRELSSIFTISVTARDRAHMEAIEAIVDEELERIRTDGVTAEELAIAQTTTEADFVRQLQQPGGFGGKADRLNRYHVFTGDPGYLASDMARYRDATTGSVADLARRYLDPDRRAIFQIVPHGTLAAIEEEVDRSTMPGSAETVAFTPPEIQRAELDNGLQLYLVERHELPLVQVFVVVRSGWAADPLERPGTASLTAELLDEGTGSLSALEISTEARRLGAQFGTGSFFDGSFISLNVLENRLDEGLELLGSVILDPTFPAEELERRRQIYLGRIQQEAAQPRAIARKAFQRRLFGPGHPYAQPMTGSATATSLEALVREDLTRFHDEHYRPNNATVIVVGDIMLDDARRRIERSLGDWQRGAVKEQSVPEPAPTSTARFWIVDKPGAEQSYIIAGHVGMAESDPARLAFDVMNNSLGAHFTARINMNPEILT